MASNSISAEDMLFHALYIGSTGAGKTNALLYWILRLFERKDVALVLIDPHGDAAFDLVRTIPESERARVALIDPEFVTFGLNPLSLPQGTEITNRVQVMQTQVEELSALLSDVLNTDASTAPRLMWIFKGALYYLHTLIRLHRLGRAGAGLRELRLHPVHGFFEGRVLLWESKPYLRPSAAPVRVEARRGHDGHPCPLDEPFCEGIVVTLADLCEVREYVVGSLWLFESK